jgi:glucokinase
LRFQSRPGYSAAGAVGSVPQNPPPFKETVMPQAAPETIRRILAADIGGTNSRFGHFTLSPEGKLDLCSTVLLPTPGYGSFVELLTALDDTDLGLSPGEADAAAFAVPGAVVGRTVTFANIGWDLDLDILKDVFGLIRSACVNDFLAHAHGCRLFDATAEIVLPGIMDPEQVQAVIGAGTGLGHAMLLPLPGGDWHALPSEAGQAAASFHGDRELAFAEYLGGLTGEPYVRGDTVLSGSGLARLHRFLTGEDLTPAAVGARLTPESETAALFARFYGRAARDYALSVLAVGGLYICGGVAAKNPLLVMHPEFGREFVESPTYGRLLAKIPVRLLRDELTGLFGAARVARKLLDPIC